MARELVPSHHDPLVIGVDVARFGEDMSVIFPRRGLDARSISPLTFRGLPLDKLEDRVVAFCNAHPVQQVFVDGTGVGGGLVDHLRRRGYLVTDVQFGAKADQQIDGVKYANQRAHIWGQMRAALRYLCLPYSPALREQLIAPEYSFSRVGDAIQLESKDLMRRRGVPSPDIADALACTYGGEIATLPALADWAQPQVISEYDPFSDAAMMDQPLPEAPRRYIAPGWAGLKWSH
jgi:phage terminase large subunit